MTSTLPALPQRIPGLILASMADDCDGDSPVCHVCHREHPGGAGGAFCEPAGAVFTPAAGEAADDVDCARCGGPILRSTAESFGGMCEACALAGEAAGAMPTADGPPACFECERGPAVFAITLIQPTLSGGTVGRTFKLCQHCVARVALSLPVDVDVTITRLAAAFTVPAPAQNGAQS